jgi:hypothetical protein
MADNPSKSNHWSMEPLLNEASIDSGLYKALRVSLVDSSGNFIGDSIPKYDYREFTRDGNGVWMGTTYKVGGAAGTTVATQTVVRDGDGNITSITTT